MPSDQPSPPGHPLKPGKKTGPARSSKSESPGSEGSPRQAVKMTVGLASSGTSHHLSSEVEKDSGFSDVSSDYLSTIEQTDTEDQSASTLRHPAKLQQAPQKASRGLPGSTFAGLTPVYIVKNVALKQPLGASAPAQFLAWSGQHSLDGLQASPARVLFIQQPLATLKPLLPSQRSAAKASFPASLSAYPRIAPHPTLDPLPKAGPPAAAPTGDTSKSKRFCLEEAWVSSSKPAAPKRGGEKLGGGEPPPPPPSDPPAPTAPGPEVLPSQDAVTSSTGSGTAGLDQAEARMISRASRKLGFGNPGRQRRFQNTVEILQKSGLLGITLRTKELIRQSGNTQRDLAELREQAQLLYEAVQSNDARAWTRLQEAMSRSADYWASKGATSYPLRGQQSLPVEAAVAVDGESPPGSPVNLSLAPDASSAGPGLP
ncbi:PREDICTED: CLOCK-interacting pacemaker-like [Gekko japonicus]|uniref:CLOCK-interacting pacemaker-like n=1 Tax=Gekko japonicus TaxID=146911 RepID=A0ABM1JM31_GEKJA|nr:PREDICTED: CLOCK-interacting pacemaker-like [Gekko japonicus]XP_015262519.1 PREDICTED: CLOCK-interacting pacemaker-like [Gekko japonicus]